MRHLRSTLYALVLAPAVWILSGVGFTHDLTGRARDSGSVETVTGLLLLLLAGAAYGILLFAPISPAGPVLFGVVYLAVGAWALAGPGSYADLWPSSVAKPGFDLSLPGYGLAVLLAVPLIGTALSARRWDRYEPPQIPLIGTLGRPRGAASVAGAMHTEILTPYAAQEADPTQVIKLPGVGVTTVLPETDATQIVDLSAPDATQVVGTAGPDETQIVGLAVPDETQIVGSAAPDETQIVEPSLLASTSTSTSDEPTEVAVGGDDTETVSRIEDDAEPVTVAVVEVTEVVVAEVVVAEVDALDGDEPKTELVVLAEGDKTELVRLEDASDKTVAAGAPEAEGSDATELVTVEDDATVFVAQPATDEPVAVPADDVTEATTAVSADDVTAATTAVAADDVSAATTAVSADDVTAATTAVAADDVSAATTAVSADDVAEATTAVYADDVTEATTAVSAEDSAPEEEPTVAAEPAVGEAVDEPTVAVTGEAPDGEPVVAQAETEAEETAAAEEVAAEEVAAAEPPAEDPAAEEPATEETATEEPVAEAAKDDEAAAEEEALEEEALQEEAAQEEAAAEEEPALFERVSPGDDQERTQVIRLPASELITHDLRGRITPAMPPPDDRPTRVINRGVLRGSDPGERTQVIRMPQRSDAAKLEPAKPEPVRTKATDEGERTQVIRLGAGTVDPPDERTQVIKLPPRTETRPETHPETHPESRTDASTEEEPETTPKGPSSVMGAERPNFAEDPTTRLMAPKTDDEDTGNGNSRTMTVTNLERPADELADDLTRPLVPGPRSPESDQS